MTNCTCKHKIFVSNFKNGDEVSHSLLFLHGKIITINSDICDCQVSVISINEMDDPISSHESIWPVSNSEFKCLVTLKKGTNTFLLKYCNAELYLSILYQLMATNLCVTPVYIICKGHDGRFQSPEWEDNSIESACDRIGVGLRLIQTAVAETLYESGYGHKSFLLQCDLNQAAPECQVFYSELPVEEAWNMTPLALWEYFGRELMTSRLASKSTKYVAFISCTRYVGSQSKQLPVSREEVLAGTRAHAALGGGGLALFGSASLHTWPCTVEEIMQRFLCSIEIDKALFMDDSYYRGTHGACFSTTLGSVCHELGHTFDLAHTKEGIMGTGYSNFHHIFILHGQTPHERESLSHHVTVSFTPNLPAVESHLSSLEKNNHETTVHIKKGEARNTLKQTPLQGSKYSFTGGTFWSESCSAILAHHRWFNSKSDGDGESPITYIRERNTVHSPSGIQVIELRDSTGMVFMSWIFKDSLLKQDFCLPSAPKFPSGSSVFAIDSVGSILKEELI